VQIPSRAEQNNSKSLILKNIPKYNTFIVRHDHGIAMAMLLRPSARFFLFSQCFIDRKDKYTY
jgi:hypothetical protein